MGTCAHEQHNRLFASVGWAWTPGVWASDTLLVHTMCDARLHMQGVADTCAPRYMMRVLPCTLSPCLAAQSRFRTEDEPAAFIQTQSRAQQSGVTGFGVTAYWWVAGCVGVTAQAGKSVSVCVCVLHENCVRSVGLYLYL